MVICAGHADVAALLLEYDANKDCRTKTGITPLFQVCGGVLHVFFTARCVDCCSDAWLISFSVVSAIAFIRSWT